MTGQFYFVGKTASFGDVSYIFVGTFIACTSKPSTHQYFGGHMIDQIDVRSLAELRKSAFVDGIWMKQGGSSPVTIKTSDLFLTYEEAEIHCKFDKDGTLQPASITEK
jgi:hypothetical protein